MFEKWGIPDYLCDNYPIAKQNMDLFVGHEKDRKFLSDLLSTKAVAVLQGEVGVGKTSLGNVVRLSKNDHFSPVSEIPCKVHWSNEEFVGIVLAAIVREITRSPSQYKKLKSNALIKELDTKYSDVSFSNYGLSVLGFGAQQGKALSRANVFNQTILLDYLEQTGRILQDHFKKETPIIIQLNNLDFPSAGDEGNLIRFFNDIRDTLQIPCINWIICGGVELENFLRTKVVRVSQIVNHVTDVLPLSEKEVKKAFEKRIKKSNSTGSLPIEDDLFHKIYTLSDGSFRQILNTVLQLLIKYNNEPLVEIINIDHARLHFQEIIQNDLDKLEKYKSLNEVFKTIIAHPGISQKEIVKILKKQQSNISKTAFDLQKQGFIQILRSGRNINYRAELKYSLGLERA